MPCTRTIFIERALVNQNGFKKSSHALHINASYFYKCCSTLAHTFILQHDDHRPALGRLTDFYQKGDEREREREGER